MIIRINDSNDYSERFEANTYYWMTVSCKRNSIEHVSIDKLKEET